jgi:hypothetical protein
VGRAGQSLQRRRRQADRNHAHRRQPADPQQRAAARRGRDDRRATHRPADPVALNRPHNAFADYLTEVTKHYHDVLGITFRTLEPLNEPNASWWKANGGQEGCHFGAANQQQIVKAVSTALTAKGITDTHLSASDENSMDDAYSILSGYDSASLAASVEAYRTSAKEDLVHLPPLTPAGWSFSTTVPAYSVTTFVVAR